MGHYDDILDRKDAEDATQYRKSELERLVSDLAQQLGHLGYTEPTAINLLLLKSEATRKYIRLKNAVDRGNILFQALLDNGEVDVKYIPKA